MAQNIAEFVTAPKSPRFNRLRSRPRLFAPTLGDARGKVPRIARRATHHKAHHIARNDTWNQHTGAAGMERPASRVTSHIKNSAEKSQASFSALSGVAPTQHGAPTENEGRRSCNGVSHCLPRLRANSLARTKFRPRPYSVATSLSIERFGLAGVACRIRPSNR